MDDPGLQQARERFLAGVADFEADRLETAQAHFEAALALAPGRPSVLVNLAHVRLRRGDAAGAAPLLEQATSAAPDDADGWALCGQALIALHRPAEALTCWERALALEPRLAPVWANRAAVLQELGRRDEAIVAYREALQHGGDAALIGHALAALTGEAVPDAPPRAYVERLFDDYADGFDDHLVGALGYRAPEVLIEGAQLLRHGAGRFASVLDLGCGTGLAAPLLRPLCERLCGVDLSARMLARARERGLYDVLVHADIATQLAATPEAAHDLVLAADVFIYVGALDAVFAGAQRALRPGGLLAFSVEPAEAPRGLVLQTSQRYAHSEEYVRTLARRSGLAVARIARDTIRHEQRAPVQALYAWLRRSPD